MLSDAVICRHCRQPLETWLAAESAIPRQKKSENTVHAARSDGIFSTPVDSRQQTFDWGADGSRVADRTAGHSAGRNRDRAVLEDTSPTNPGGLADEREPTTPHIQYPYMPIMSRALWPRMAPFISAVAFGAVSVAIIAWPDQTDFDAGFRISNPFVAPAPPVSPADRVRPANPVAAPELPSPPKPSASPYGNASIDAPPPEPDPAIEPSPKSIELFSKGQPRTPPEEAFPEEASPPPAAASASPPAKPPTAAVPEKLEEISPPPEMAPAPAKPSMPPPAAKELARKEIANEKATDFTSIVATISREAAQRAERSAAAKSPMTRQPPPETVTASGELVVLVQQRLRLLGYDCGKIDGRVGPATAKQIRAFQRDEGMVPNGQVDFELMRRLGIVGEKIDAFRTDVEGPKAP